MLTLVEGYQPIERPMDDHERGVHLYQGNAVRIETKRFGLRSQPTDSGFAIFELRGKERFTAEAVI